MNLRHQTVTHCHYNDIHYSCSLSRYCTASRVSVRTGICHNKTHCACLTTQIGLLIVTSHPLSAGDTCDSDYTAELGQ